MMTRLKKEVVGPGRLAVALGRTPSAALPLAVTIVLTSITSFVGFQQEPSGTRWSLRGTLEPNLFAATTSHSNANSDAVIATSPKAFYGR